MWSAAAIHSNFILYLRERHETGESFLLSSLSSDILLSFTRQRTINFPCLLFSNSPIVGDVPSRRHFPARHFRSLLEEMTSCYCVENGQENDFTNLSKEKKANDDGVWGRVLIVSSLFNFSDWKIKFPRFSLSSAKSKTPKVLRIAFKIASNFQLDCVWGGRRKSSAQAHEINWNSILINVCRFIKLFSLSQLSFRLRLSHFP